MTPVNSFNLLKELAQILMPNKFVDDIKPVVKKKRRNYFEMAFSWVLFCVPCFWQLKYQSYTKTDLQHTQKIPFHFIFLIYELASNISHLWGF